MSLRMKAAVLAVVLMHPGGTALAMSEAMGECLLARIATADGGVTVDELNSACIEQIGAADTTAQVASGTQRQSAVGIRREADEAARDQRFVISTHRPNYFLYTYDSEPNEVPFGAPEGTFDDEEIKLAGEDGTRHMQRSARKRRRSRPTGTTLDPTGPIRSGKRDGTG